MGKKEESVKLSDVNNNLIQLLKIMANKTKLLSGMDEILFSERSILERTEWSRTELWRRIKNKNFPAPDMSDPKRWRRSTFNDWILKHQANAAGNG
jgi:predicted DNA-binding transcriptional regulator AlpA